MFQETNLYEVGVLKVNEQLLFNWSTVAELADLM